MFADFILGAILVANSLFVPARHPPERCTPATRGRQYTEDSSVAWRCDGRFWVKP